MPALKATDASLGLAILGIAILSFANVFVFRNIDKLAMLESRTDCEVVMNGLFASLRDHDDFGSAIEASSSLSKDIVGLGLYNAEGGLVYSWGSAPAAYSAPVSSGRDAQSRVKDFIANPSKDSFILLLKPFGIVPPPRRPRAEGAAGPEGARDPAMEEEPPGPPPSEHPFLFTTLRSAKIVYLEIRQPAYWDGRRARAVFLPLVEVLLVALVLFMRGLVLRNRDYRRRIEEQRNLVVLGTAASTLAHEIKNPLLSIRLQSSILEKVCPVDGRRELDIINGEVDRLSALSYRVNDWLREPLGRPQNLELAGFLREVSLRVLGADRVRPEPGPDLFVSMDADRLRSVLENILRNAVESEGPEEGIAIEASQGEGRVLIEVLDRGRGIPKENRERAFDPFFTTKSRGSGIGLAISRRFVEAAGGTIRIEARKGGGTRVSVSLPRPASETPDGDKDGL